MASKGAKVGLSVVGLVVLVIAAGLAGLGYLVYKQLGEGSITAGTYESIKVGQSQAEVLGKLPGEQSDLAVTGLAKETPKPAGATCRYHAAKIDDGTKKTVPVYRFCFAGGKLTDKTTQM